MSSSESGDDLDVKKALGEEEEDADDTLANADVSTKYQEAAKIANVALDVVLSKVEVGKTPLELSQAGDEVIEEKCKKIFTKKVKGRTIEKGVAFPTCVSINECVCHNSPLASEAQEPLKEGDLVKVDLGVHIDGFVSVVAHTVRVGTWLGRKKTMGRAGGFVLSLLGLLFLPSPPCYPTHMHARPSRTRTNRRGAHQGPSGRRLPRSLDGVGGGDQTYQARKQQQSSHGGHGPGGRGFRSERHAGNLDASNEAVRVLGGPERAERRRLFRFDFLVQTLPLPSFRPRHPHAPSPFPPHPRYIIDGNKVIILREDVDQKVDDVVFEQGEIYSVDVAFSSGEGACGYEILPRCVVRETPCREAPSGSSVFGPRVRRRMSIYSLP